MHKIPVTIITGFLGAGKTTLIRHLLEQNQGKHIALIINEFGDVGVDGNILKGCGDALCPPGSIIELANGCICCTVADDFLPAMKSLLSLEKRPEHIIIETSGLALPQPLLRAFQWPDVATDLTIDGVITVVDGKALAEGRYADDEAAVQAMRLADPNLAHENPLQELYNDQLNCADLVVVTKTDLLEPETTTDILASVQAQVRLGVRAIICPQPAQLPAIIFGLGAAAEADGHNRLSTHEMEGEEQHDHDDFVSFSVQLPQVETRAELLARLNQIIQNGAILRIKGFAAVAGSSSRLLVQAVGPRIESYFDRLWAKDELRTTQLVVIGVKGMDIAPIRAALEG